jgi:hypothetical protein
LFIALIEQQIYRQFTTLKSKETQKYICLNENNGHFIMKSVKDIDEFCVFNYKVVNFNSYTFSIGSQQTTSKRIVDDVDYKSVDLAADKFGFIMDASIQKNDNREPSLIKHYRSRRFPRQRRRRPGIRLRRRRYHECLASQSSVFHLHTKLTDVVVLSPNIQSYSLFYKVDKLTTTTTTTTKASTSTLKMNTNQKNINFYPKEMKITYKTWLNLRQNHLKRHQRRFHIKNRRLKRKHLILKFQNFKKMRQQRMIEQLNI